MMTIAARSSTCGRLEAWRASTGKARFLGFGLALATRRTPRQISFSENRTPGSENHTLLSVSRVYMFAR